MTWPTIALGEVMADRVVGLDTQRFPTELFQLWSIPAYDEGKPEEVIGSSIGSPKKVLEPNDVLLSRIVPHIRRAWVVSRADGLRQVGSGEWIVFRDTRFVPEYLRHFLLSDSFHAQFMSTLAGVGGSLMRARPTEVARLRTPLPTRAEQRRIAAILDQADVVRRKRQKAITAQDRLIPAKFRSVFLSKTLSEPVPLGELFNITRGGSPRPIADYLTEAPDGLNWVSISDATDSGKFIRSTKRRIKYSGAERSRRVEPGDFLLTNSMSFGRPYIMATTGYIHDGWLSLRPRDDRIDPEYLYQALNSAQTQARFAQLAAGATVKNLNIDLVKSVAIPVPPRALQDRFAAFVRKADANIEKTRVHQRHLDSLFASLQHRAFAGEL